MIQLVDDKLAEKIIITRKPLGKFWLTEKNSGIGRRFVGIYNEDGNAWTEDFPNFKKLAAWFEVDKTKGIYFEFVAGISLEKIFNLKEWNKEKTIPQLVTIYLESGDFPHTKKDRKIIHKLICDRIKAELY